MMEWEQKRQQGIQGISPSAWLNVSRGLAGHTCGGGVHASTVAVICKIKSQYVVEVRRSTKKYILSCNHQILRRPQQQTTSNFFYATWQGQKAVACQFSFELAPPP